MLPKYNLKVLVAGGKGGREEAIVWKFAQSPRVGKIYLAQKSASISRYATGVNLETIEEMADFAQREKIDLTFVGPERWLSAGIVDEFEKRNLAIIGPSKAAARLEYSKCDAKKIMRDLGIPVPPFKVFDNPEAAKHFVLNHRSLAVVKADGLAAGKGSIVCDTHEEAEAAIDLIMVKKAFGDAGNRVDIEDRLYGQELSFFCFTDGHSILPLPAAQDYKPVGDGNTGKNTGGMGSYSPHPWLDEKLQKIILDKVAKPLIDGYREKYGCIYKGVLYLGLMIVEEKGELIPYVLEINVRFGDPEAQVIIPRIQNDFADICEAILTGTLEKIKLIEDPNYYLCLCATSGRTKGKKGWYKGYPDRYKIKLPITGLDKISKDALVFHAGTDRDESGQWVTTGGRVLGIVSKGETLNQARRTAYLEMEKIKFEGIYYRRDIGKE